jgi:hypothetical protein
MVSGVYFPVFVFAHFIAKKVPITYSVPHI